MNKKRIFIIAGICAASIIIASGTRVYVLKWKAQQNAGFAQNTPLDKSKLKNEQESKKEADISNWKTYRDEKYKFEIKYNPSWKIIAEKGGSPMGERLAVVPDISRKDLGMSISRIWSRDNPKDWYTGQGFSGTTFDKQYFINEYPAYYVKIDNSRVYVLHQYIISNQKSIVSLTFQEVYRDVDANTGMITETSFSEYLPDFGAMVNSIRFFD